MPNVANTLRPGTWSLHRSVTGAPVGADGAPSGTFPVRSGLLNCAGYKTILVKPVLTAGGASDVTLDVLGYDPDLDVFGVLASLANVSTGVVKEVTVDGQRVFLRITAAVGAPTAVELRVSAGQTDESA